MGDDRHETAGTVFAEALRQWREAVSRDADESPTDPEADEREDEDDEQG